MIFSKIKNYIKAKLVHEVYIKNPVYIPTVYGEFLKGKTVLITGGAGGIGFAIADVCLRNGANVIITGRNIEKLKNAVNELEQKNNCHGKIFCIDIDIMNISELSSKIKLAAEISPDRKIDILVNNAGVSSGASIGKTKEEDYDSVLNTNLKGTYFMAQEFSNYLIENKIEGNILNISSSSGMRPAASPYMVSKWGINGLTEGLAKKLIKYGIVVNGIAPGPTAAGMLQKDTDDLTKENSPAKRFSDPNEIANIALFLISDTGRMIVGDTVYVTGGSGTLTYDDFGY